jgi:hypothetical protein
MEREKAVGFSAPVAGGLPFCLSHSTYFSSFGNASFRNSSVPVGSVSFECFPYACPEPLLVKRSFVYKKCKTGTGF